MKHLIISLVLLIISSISFSQSGSDATPLISRVTFIPDYTFTGSSLTGWHNIGPAKWSAKDGEITATAKKGAGNSFLVLDTSYQDVAFYTLFKYTGDSEIGLLFRKEKTGDSTKAVLLSINKDEVVPYSVFLNAEGKELKRDRLRYAGGIWYRIAPPADDKNEQVRRGNTLPPRPEPEVKLPIERPDTDLRPGEWNQIEVFMDANVIRSFLNDGREIGGAVDGDEGLHGYGPIALFMRGPGEVKFKNIMLKDVSLRETPTEESSSRFEVQRISDMYYSWGADAADFNNDGIMDVVAGPYIYYGPDFTQHKEIFPAIAVGPSKEFTSTNVQFTYDFNGDGWPDILTSPSRAVLFINPKGESRRWNSYNILPAVQSEITDFVDIDGDGDPELVYGADGSLRYAKFDKEDPTKPWKEHIISEKGYSLAHGIGTGDINGDGRIDILNPFGWWEQPEILEEGKLWKYHPEQFGRYGYRSGGIGGSLMAVYDINGNGLNDIITSLNAHGFGMAWFEQKRDENGNISFTKHMISDGFTSENAGDVTFSQPHGAAFADIDKDGVPDFIVGKRYFTHLDNHYDPDSYGAPVIYWYKTVRNANAPGGAEFVPELIHNRSGAGSEVTAVDLNKNGNIDIITSTNRGTFIYWNKTDKK